MYQRILVPLDGSPYAEHILPHVEQLARAFGAEVIFACVVRDWGPLAERPVRKDSMKHYLDEITETFIEKGFRARFLIVDGNPFNDLLPLVQRERLDLIAISSHARTGFAALFGGSLALHLARHAEVPVLLVRTKEYRVQV